MCLAGLVVPDIIPLAIRRCCFLRAPFLPRCCGLKRPETYVSCAVLYRCFTTALDTLQGLLWFVFVCVCVCVYAGGGGGVVCLCVFRGAQWCVPLLVFFAFSVKLFSPFVSKSRTTRWGSQEVLQGLLRCLGGGITRGDAGPSRVGGGITRGDAGIAPTF